MSTLFCTFLVGAGATAAMDLWAIARRRLLGSPLPDYGVVGRWLAGIPKGRLFHKSITAAAPVEGERLIGWAAHYLIGVAFAAVLIAAWGTAWIREPELGPALIVGIGTVAAPFLLMQPGMGAGIAASRTARPWAARLQSVATHTVFGFGLYATGSALSFVAGR